MAKKKSNVIRYRKPTSLNIGFLIFAAILIYLAYHVIAYAFRDKVRIFEVGQPVSLVENTTYTGLVLRSEEVTYTQAAGYVNYYIREGNRASVGSVVYSLDENGQFTQLLSSSASDTSSLSQENLSELKRSLANFNLRYQSQEFSQVYDLKYSLENQLLSFVSTNSLEDLESLGIDTAYFHTIPASQSGIVVYYTDGYEALDAGSVTEEDFDTDAYQRSDIRSGQLLESGSPAYKTITSEAWSILIPLTEEEAEAYRQQMTEESEAGGAPVNTLSLEVRFPERDLSATVNFSLAAGADGKTYGKLDLSRYMVQFANQRYVQVEIRRDRTAGLKIPKTALLEKEFLTVPVEYASGQDGSKTFVQENYSAEGTSAQVIEPTIYYATEENYYLDPNQVAPGTTLAKPDSSDRYTLGETSSLQGVYQVNRGYAVFKQVQILDENEEYVIVEKGTDYGVAVYDQILLDSSLVSEGEILYR